MAEPQLAHDPESGQTYVFNPNTGRYQVAFEGPLEAFLVGAGRSLTRLGRGARGLVMNRERGAMQAAQQAEDALTLPAGEQYGLAFGAGEAAPGLATAPLGMGAALAGRMGMRQALGLAGGIGAAEGGLMLDPTGQNLDNALVGALAGVGGDLGGRVAGRLFNAITGAGQALARSEAGTFLERRGMQSLPSERLNVPGQNVTPLQRLEQGAQSGVFTPRVFREIAQERADLMNEAAAKAVGLPGVPPGSTGLDAAALSQANEQISEGFQELARTASRTGGNSTRFYKVGEDIGERILRTKGQIAELERRGEFAGLMQGILRGNEIMIARRALAQDAANAAKRGEYELADSIFADVDVLDQVFADTVGDPEIIARHAALREQYRNLQLIMKPGVVNAAGEVRPTVLNRYLGAGTGYGDAYRLGRGAEHLPETAELFDVTRNLAAPELQPFRSSGTAENLAMRDDAAAIGAALADPTGAGGVGLLGRLAAPMTMSALGGSNRLANVAGGLLTQAPAAAPIAGRTAGLGLLEQIIGERYANRQAER